MIDRSRFARRYRRFKKRAIGYTDLIFWFLQDLGLHLRWDSLRLVLTGGAHLGVRYAALGVLYYCIRYFEGDREHTALEITLPGLNALQFLTIALIFGLGLLTLAAGLRYKIREKAIRISQAYEEFCLRRLLSLAGRLPDPRATEASHEVASGLVFQQIGYVRQCAFLTKQLGVGLPAVAGLLIGSLLLVAINPLLTGSIGLVAAAILSLQYPANRRAVKASYDFEQFNLPAVAKVRGILANLRSAPMPLAHNSAVLDNLFKERDVRKAMKGNSERFRAVEQAALASQVGGIIVLGTGLVLLGIGLVKGDITFAHGALYLGVVRFVLRDFVRVSRLFASINRFYAQVRQHVSFVRSAGATTNQCSAAPRFSDVSIDFAIAGMDEDDETLAVAGGDVLALVVPAATAVSLPGIVADSIRPASQFPASPPIQIGTPLFDSAVSLRESLVLPAGADLTALTKAIEDFAPDDQPLAWASEGWIERSPEKRCDQEIPRWAIVALQVLAAKLRGNEVLLLEVALLRTLSEKWCLSLRSHLADRLFVIVHRDASSVGDFGESAAIVCDTEEAVSWVKIRDNPNFKPQLEAACSGLADAAAASTVAKAALIEEIDVD